MNSQDKHVSLSLYLTNSTNKLFRGLSVMSKKNMIVLMMFLTTVVIAQPAQAGVWDKVSGEIQHRRNQVKQAAVKTHPFYLQLVVVLKGAKATKVITSKSECYRAINDSASGARSVVDISPLVHGIGKSAGEMACRDVF
jgi:hypothetical protein